MKKILIMALSAVFLIALALGAFIYIDTTVFKSKTFCDYLNPNLGGVGIVTVLEDSKPKIAEVVEGLPAQKAGIQQDDYILKVNNKKVEDIPDVVKNLRGKINSKVKVTIKRNDEIKEYTLVREKILVENGYFKFAPNIFLRQNYLKYQDGIYYFYVKVFPCPCGHDKNKFKAKNIAYREEFIAVNPKDNKFLKLEVKSYDKNDKLIKTETNEEKKENFKEITPEDYGCVFIGFVNDIDTTVPKRYKDKLKGDL